MVLLTLITIFAWMATLGGSVGLAGVAIMGSIVLGMYWIREIGVTNYNPPKGIDHDKMGRDIKSGANANTLKNNMLAGKYDKR